MALASTAMTRTGSFAVELSGWRLVSDAVALALQPVGAGVPPELRIHA